MQRLFFFGRIPPPGRIFSFAFFRETPDIIIVRANSRKQAKTSGMPMFKYGHMKETSVENEKNIEAEIAELLSGVGLQLLEFSLGRQKGNVKVKAVIYSPKGTGTDECTKAYRLILPRIQLATNNQNPEIEVASPGIDRLIKTKREWQAFVGNAIKVLEKDQTEWVSGILKSADETAVVLENRNGRKTYEYTAIVKARLDSSYKGE